MIIKASVLALALLAPAAFADTTFLPDSALTASTSYYTDNLGAVAMSPNDDYYTDRIDLGFNFTLYGKQYSSLYINNNGNVSFNNPIATYTPSGPTGVSEPIVSPYFADVDTRGAGSGQVYYRIENDTLYVTWDNVAITPSTPTCATASSWYCAVMMLRLPTVKADWFFSTKTCNGPPAMPARARTARAVIRRRSALAMAKAMRKRCCRRNRTISTRWWPTATSGLTSITGAG